MYSKSSKTIEVIVDTKDDNLLIAVKDTGIGVSHSDKKKLFTKFFRSANASEQNTEGSGLGLYVVKSYIDEWGGTISVESSEGKGSTFSITLPLNGKSNAKKSN
jgi:signal transduction histidine kinase